MNTLTKLKDGRLRAGLSAAALLVAFALAGCGKSGTKDEHAGEGDKQAAHAGEKKEGHSEAESELTLTTEEAARDIMSLATLEDTDERAVRLYRDENGQARLNLRYLLSQAPLKAHNSQRSKASGISCCRKRPISRIFCALAVAFGMRGVRIHKRLCSWLILRKFSRMRSFGLPVRR